MAARSIPREVNGSEAPAAGAASALEAGSCWTKTSAPGSASAGTDAVSQTPVRMASAGASPS
eukprot:1414696-Lingulodinium_polyedra.AAC.1